MVDTIFYYSDNTTSTSSDTILTRSSWVVAKSLVNVNIGDGVIQIGDYSGNGTFADCNDLIELIIPNNVTTIGIGIVIDAQNLKKITVGRNLTSLGEEAFAYTPNLEKVYFLGNAPTLGLNAFANTNINLNIYRYSTKSGWSNTFGGKTVLLIDSPIHKSLQTFGFPNISSGKISIKKQNTGSGKITAKPTILKLWLKSDAGVILDGSNVIGWTDQSGNSRNFTKSIPNTGFPTFSDGAVLFTATNMYNDPNASVLALPSARLNFTIPYTLITVVRAGANNSAVFNKSNGEDKRRKYQIAVNGGIIYSLESTNSIECSPCDTNIEYDTGTGDDVSVKRLIVSQYSSNTFGLLRYNGAQVATGSTNVGIDQTNSASIFIGAAAFDEGSGYNAEGSNEMYVYEILFYNQALSTFEIQQIETYLNNKYSIY